MSHVVARYGAGPTADVSTKAAFLLRAGHEARWSAVGKGVQGVALILAGIFLLSKMSIAPQLAVQVVLLGTVLVIGGVVLAINALATMTSHLTVDREGLRGRLGLTTLDLEWADLAKWRVSDHDGRLSAIACAEFWVNGGDAQRSLPGGFLDREARRLLREACRSFAPNQEHC